MRVVRGGDVMRIMAVVLLFAAALTGSGCGYALVGRSNALPASVRSIAVPVFRNSTQRPGVEQWISEAVARELAGRGGLTVPASSEGADAILEGEVSSYTAWPSALDPSGRASEYQIVVVANVRLTSRQGETILKISGFQFQESYPIVSNSRSANDFSDQENVAVEALASKFAESLVSAVLEGF